MRVLATIALLCALFAGCGGGVCRSLAPPVVDGRMLPAPIACHETYTGRCCVWQVDGCLVTFCDSQFACAWELRKLIRRRGADECEVPAGYTLLTVTRPPRLRGLTAPRPTPIQDGGSW